MSSNNEYHKITKKIIKIIKVNMNKNIKWIYRFKDKLIIFIYYLKLFFTLNHNINNLNSVIYYHCRF